MRDSFAATATSTNDADVVSGAMPKRRKVDNEKVTSVKKFFVSKIAENDETNGTPKIEFFEKNECKRNQELDESKVPKIEFFGKENFRSQKNSPDSKETNNEVSEETNAGSHEFSCRENSTEQEHNDVTGCDDRDVIESRSDAEQVDSANDQPAVDVPHSTLVKVWDDDAPGFEPVTRKTVSVHFSVDDLRNRCSKKKVEKSDKDVFRRFLAQISPTENEDAEQELRKEFKKDDFKAMKIFGQVR